MQYEEFRLWFEEKTGMTRDQILDMIENDPWDEWLLVVKRLYVAVAMAAGNVTWKNDVTTMP